jgi:hypothetical protein
LRRACPRRQHASFMTENVILAPAYGRWITSGTASRSHTGHTVCSPSLSPLALPQLSREEGGSLPKENCPAVSHAADRFDQSHAPAAGQNRSQLAGYRAQVWRCVGYHMQDTPWAASAISAFQPKWATAQGAAACARGTKPVEPRSNRTHTQNSSSLPGPEPEPGDQVSRTQRKSLTGKGGPPSVAGGMYMQTQMGGSAAPPLGEHAQLLGARPKQLPSALTEN